jgi:hypothetical protein
MQELIKTIRKNSQVLVQVSKRAEEISILQEMVESFQSKSGVFAQQRANSNMFNSCKFDEFTVTNNVADSCVCLKVDNQKIPFVISGFSKDGNRTFVHGSRFTSILSFFKTTYFDSSKCKIFPKLSVSIYVLIFFRRSFKM